MGRRHTVDEETAAIATQRLAGLLADLGPRRALPEIREGLDPEPDEPPAEGASLPPGWRAAISLPARARTFGRQHLGVLAVLLVIGLGAGGWALLRARPLAEATPLALATTAEPVSSPTSPQAGAGSGRASPATTPAATILVHVVGAVRRPGVVTLPERARVNDAIDAAGGLRDDARPVELNLAQIVQDGQQVVIGTARRPGGEVRDGSTAPGSASGGSVTGSGSAAGGAGGATVDLNTATLAQLDTLPGVGPVTAERIIAWRTEHRRFSRVEELQEVDGIGPKTYAQLAPHVRV